MTPPLVFEGQIETMPWGRAVYTVLPLPAEIAAALVSARRVEGEIADHPVNLAVVRAPARSGPFLWAGKSLLDRIGARPGDIVEARLRPAPDDAVDTPDDVAAALDAARVIAAWEALSPGKRRGHLYQIEGARKPATRGKHIAALVATLGGGA